MAQKSIVYITSINTKGEAFGIREDNDEDVFFKSSIVEALELEELDEVEAVMIASKSDNINSTAWFAIRARLLEEEID